MKVKVLCRLETRTIMFERRPEIYSEVSREYTRALNATKLQRVFAKPFVASLDGHRDGISCIIKHAKSLSTIISGACDGEVKVWNLPKRDCLRTVQAHERFVRGICSRFCGTSFLTVGDDKTIKQWSMEAPVYGDREEPINMILGKAVFTGIDHHQREGTEVYHTKRMQHVNCVRWSADNKYVLSGSDEMNIRLWKANASEKLGLLSAREKAAANYKKKLIEKFQHHPRVKRIARHRHLPRDVLKQKREMREMKEGTKRPQTQQAGICSSADRKGETCGGCCGVRADLKRRFRWMGFCFSTHGHAPKYSTLWPLLYFHTNVLSVHKNCRHTAVCYTFLKNFTWTHTELSL